MLLDHRLLKLLKVFLTISAWGKKYRGDFLAGTIAFLFPLTASLALRGQSALDDITTYPSIFGLFATVLPLVLSFNIIAIPLLKTYRKKRFKEPIKIGILNGELKGKGDQLPKTPVYSASDWKTQILSTNNNVDLIAVNDVSDNYALILNPFGEEYPEIDKPNLSSLQRITKFIQDGGVFVNTAGLAFFYVWDGIKQDISGELFETYSIDKIPCILEPAVRLDACSLTKTTLYKMFGVRTTIFDSKLLQTIPIEDNYFKDLDQAGGSITVREFRSSYRCEKSNLLLIPLLKAEHTWKKQDGSIKRFDCYPIAAVKFGKGYLILNGIALEALRPEDFQKEIEAIKRILKKLGERGEL